MVERNKEAVETASVEIASMLQLSHIQGVQRLVGVWPDQMALISENAGRSVKHCVRRGQLDGRDKRRLVLSLAETVRAMHQARRVHNDLHSDNVCVRRGETGEPQAVLIDFGQASNLRVFAKYSLGNGDDSHLPPELYKGAKQTETTEVFTLGFLVSFIYSKDVPEDMSEWVRKARGKPCQRPSVQELIDALTGAEKQAN